MSGIESNIIFNLNTDCHSRYCLQINKSVSDRFWSEYYQLFDDIYEKCDRSEVPMINSSRGVAPAKHADFHWGHSLQAYLNIGISTMTSNAKRSI